MAHKPHYSWLSIHLYYEEPWELFLSKIIKPYCDTVIGSGAADYYFFIRYWERGPHIRLRFYGQKDALENILKPNLEEYFNNYFKMLPSLRDEPSYHPSQPAFDIWLPNNSIQWIDYEPELTRYAGSYSIGIAERNFAASSVAVLQSISDVGAKNWNYEQSLGIAIKMHLSLVHAMGLSISEVVDFFHGILHHWLPMNLQRERITQAQLSQQTETLLHTFEQLFSEQQEPLVTFHAAFWEALENRENESFEEDYLNDWYEACVFSKQEFRLAQVQNLLEQRPEMYKIYFFQHKDPTTSLLWELYADFFHLTNNRLGIANRDESYMAFLMMRSVEELGVIIS